MERQNHKGSTYIPVSRPELQMDTITMTTYLGMDSPGGGRTRQVPFLTTRQIPMDFTPRLKLDKAEEVANQRLRWVACGEKTVAK